MNTAIFQTDSFGGVSPYFIQQRRPAQVFSTAEEAIMALPDEDRVLDPVGIMEIFDLHYMCGARTLVRPVKRMTWRAELMEDGTLVRRPPVPHGLRHLDAGEAAGELCRRLETELLEAIGARKRVYLLLTGGLDSRLVAGVLHRAKAQIRAEIVAVTWGCESSRDVHYARRIADWFGWNFIHVPYGAEWTWENIQCMATWGGAEIAGTHLHAMNWCARLSPDDLVIASSFGDSIGRAEFSGVSMLNLPRPSACNHFGRIHPNLEGACLREARDDLATSWALIDDAPDCVRWEHHQQENYMRRMICHAMDRIRSFAGLHQAFTSEPVVAFMWGLCPMMRNGAIYARAFKDLDERLFRLPWARTGLAPDGVTKEADPDLAVNYHDYVQWCSHELAQRLEAHAFSNDLFKLGFLYAPNWNRLYHRWKNVRGRTGEGLVRDVVVLAQIDLARMRFNLQPCRPSEYWRDRARGLLWPVVHQARRAFGGS